MLTVSKPRCRLQFCLLIACILEYLQQLPMLLLIEAHSQFSTIQGLLLVFSLHFSISFVTGLYSSVITRNLLIFRACPSEFVIPLAKYRKSVYGTQLSVGMRFGMMFETEESGKRRQVCFSGFMRSHSNSILIIIIVRFI